VKLVNNAKSISIREHLTTASAYGAALGDRHRALIAAMFPPSSPAHDASGWGEILEISFRSVEAATTSYLKALLLPLLDAGASTIDRARYVDASLAPNTYPVLLDLNGELRSELDDLLRSSPRTVLEKTAIGADGRLIVRVHGILDPASANTLASLCRLHETSAPEIHNNMTGSTSSISVTAWNNRLNDLVLRRLARRCRQGRQWRYRPVGYPETLPQE
jgi:hypothetical protein